MGEVCLTLIHAIYYDGHELPFVSLALITMSVVMLPLLTKKNTVHTHTRN